MNRRYDNQHRTHHGLDRRWCSTLPRTRGATRELALQEALARAGHMGCSECGNPFLVNVPAVLSEKGRKNGKFRVFHVECVRRAYSFRAYVTPA
jgi:hypothetical protein